MGFRKEQPFCPLSCALSSLELMGPCHPGPRGDIWDRLNDHLCGSPEKVTLAGGEEPGREREHVEEGGVGFSGEAGGPVPSRRLGRAGWGGPLTSAAASLRDLGHIPSPLWPSLPSLLPKEVKLTAKSTRCVEVGIGVFLGQCWVPSARHRAHAQ